MSGNNENVQIEWLNISMGKVTLGSKDDLPQPQQPIDPEDPEDPENPIEEDALPQEVIDAGFTSIEPGQDIGSIMAAGSPGDFFVLEGGTHRLHNLGGPIVGHKANQRLYGRTKNGPLINDGVERGTCVSIVSGAVKPTNWIKVSGKELWFSDGHITAKTQKNGGGGSGGAGAGSGDNGAFDVATSLGGDIGGAENEQVWYDDKLMEHVQDYQGQKAIDKVEGNFRCCYDYSQRLTNSAGTVTSVPGRVYIGKDPALATAGGVELAYGIHSPFKSDVDGIQLHNIRFCKYAQTFQRALMHPGGGFSTQFNTTTEDRNWTFRGCLIEQAHGALMNMTDGWDVQNCIFRKGSQIGVRSLEDDESSTKVTGLIFKFNIIEDCVLLDGMKVGWEAGGTKFSHSNGAEIAYNLIRNCRGNGLWLDVDNINLNVHHNLVEDHYNGIFMEFQGGGNYVEHNLIRRCGGGDTFPDYPLINAGRREFARAGVRFSSCDRMNGGPIDGESPDFAGTRFRFNVIEIPAENYKAERSVANRSAYGLTVNADGRGPSAGFMCAGNRCVWLADTLSTNARFGMNFSSGASTSNIITTRDTASFEDNQMWHVFGPSARTFQGINSSNGRQTYSLAQWKNEPWYVGDDPGFLPSTVSSRREQVQYASRVPDASFDPRSAPVA